MRFFPFVSFRFSSPRQTEKRLSRFSFSVNLFRLINDLDPEISLRQRFAKIRPHRHAVYLYGPRRLLRFLVEERRLIDPTCFFIRRVSFFLSPVSWTVTFSYPDATESDG